MNEAPLRADLQPLPELPELERRWRALERGCGGAPSFFLSWDWIGPWLAATGARPRLFSVTQGAREVALALVGQGARRTKFGAVPMLLLNEAGEEEADRAFIEYNGLLTGPSDAAPSAALLIETLMQDRRWRTLRIAGVAGDSPLLTQPGFARATRYDASPAYYVDLGAVRAKGDYLDLLSSNTRGQVRKSLRDRGGEASVVRAGAADVAPWLAEMQRLNVGRHADNAWDRPVFRAFADALVRQGLDSGCTDLLRIAIGGQHVGYLLNILHDGRAMNYQSAFVDPAGGKDKPGLMAHAAAVAHYAARDFTRYSFLAGKDRYKQSLSTDAEALEWWWLDRRSLRLSAEHRLRALLKRPASA